MTLILVTVLVVSLAFSNGANDVSKGVATLFGGGLTQSRLALFWGMSGNVFGGLMAILFGRSLVQTFGGGFLIPRFDEKESFMVTVLLGAVLWVFFATIKGWPVSTTHALIGSIMGSALVFAGIGSFKWGSLWGKAILPLLLSPLLSMGMVYVLWKIRRTLIQTSWYSRFFYRNIGGKKTFGGGEPNSNKVEWKIERMVHGFHWVTAGATSFARGLNDVPKMAALLIVAWSGSYPNSTGKEFAISIILVSVAMGFGGIWKGLRILKVLSHQVTQLTPSTGLIANVSIALPTLLASPFGLPVSTTHVSAGALFGIRFMSGKSAPENDALQSILWAWLITFPATAFISGFFALISLFFSGS